MITTRPNRGRGERRRQQEIAERPTSSERLDAILATIEAGEALTGVHEPPAGDTKSGARAWSGRRAAGACRLRPRRPGAVAALTSRKGQRRTVATGIGDRAHVGAEGAPRDGHERHDAGRNPSPTRLYDRRGGQRADPEDRPGQRRGARVGVAAAGAPLTGNLPRHGDRQDPRRRARTRNKAAVAAGVELDGIRHPPGGSVQATEGAQF